MKLRKVIAMVLLLIVLSATTVFAADNDVPRITSFPTPGIVSMR